MKKRVSLRGRAAMKRQVVAFSVMLIFFFPAFFALGAAGKDEDSYVGAGVCQECHVEQTKSMSKTPHWKKAIKGSPVANKECESCHGPGAAHVREGGGTTRDLITFTKKETAKQKSEACLACHQNSKEITSQKVLASLKALGMATRSEVKALEERIKKLEAEVKKIKE